MWDVINKDGNDDGNDDGDSDGDGFGDDIDNVGNGDGDGDGDSDSDSIAMRKLCGMAVGCCHFNKNYCISVDNVKIHKSSPNGLDNIQFTLYNNNNGFSL